jgi:hypothetical protein
VPCVLWLLNACVLWQFAPANPLLREWCRWRGWGSLAGSAALIGPAEVLKRPYYSASALLTNAVTAVTSGGRVTSSSREKDSQHEDESFEGHGRRRSGGLGRWCDVDRTIGLGGQRLLQFAPAQGRTRVQLRFQLRPGYSGASGLHGWETGCGTQPVEPGSNTGRRIPTLRPGNSIE